MPYAQPVQSVLRAIDVLEAVADADAGLTLSQVAEQLGLRTTTVANLVRTLALRGYISRETSRAPLKLGPSARQLVDHADASNIIKRVERHLRELVRLHPTCGAVYSEHTGGEVRLRLRLDPRFPGRAERPRNEVLNPYNKAQSLVFLAFGHHSILQDTLQRFHFHDYAMGQFTSQQAFDQLLESSRKQGYVCPPGASMPHFRMGVPIYDHRQSLIGAIGVYAHPEPDPAKRGQIIQDTLDAANSISHPSPDAHHPSMPESI